MSSYFIWMNESRDRIKEEYGCDGIAEASKKAGEIWKEMSESEKAPYEEKNREAKERYEEEMREYNRKVESGEIVPVEGKGKAPKKKPSKPAGASSSSPKKGMSKEYVDSDDISSDSDESDNEPISKKKKDASGSEDEVKDEPKEEPDSYADSD